MIEDKINKIRKREIPKKIKIMWFSNEIRMPTGFSKVSRSVCKGLAKDPKFEVYCIGEQYSGPPLIHDGYLLLGCKQPTNFYAESIINHINHYKPDFFVALEDSFTLGESNFNLQNVNFSPSKFVMYLPLDGGDPEGGFGGAIPTTGLKVIRRADKIISMSKFTQEELKKEGFESDMIWHGCDTSVFKPCSKEEQNKLKVKHGFKPEEFIVFTYFRNSMRKRPWRHLETLAKFLKDKPNAKALLHVMNYSDPSSDLLDLLDRHLYNKYNVNFLKEGRIKYTPNTEGHSKPLSDEEVAELIKMSDITFSANSGEGFGLLMAESMACGKPIAVTDYSTSKELIIDGKPSPRGLLVKYLALETAGLNTTHALVDPDDMVKQMNKYYLNPKLIEEHGKNGVEFVDKNLKWEIILKQWKEWFLKNV